MSGFRSLPSMCKLVPQTSPQEQANLRREIPFARIHVSGGHAELQAQLLWNKGHAVDDGQMISFCELLAVKLHHARLSVHRDKNQNTHTHTHIPRTRNTPSSPSSPNAQRPAFPQGAMFTASCPASCLLASSEGLPPTWGCEVISPQ